MDSGFCRQPVRWTRSAACLVVPRVKRGVTGRITSFQTPSSRHEYMETPSSFFVGWIRTNDNRIAKTGFIRYSVVNKSILTGYLHYSKTGLDHLKSKVVTLDVYTLVGFVSGQYRNRSANWGQPPRFFST